MNNDRKVDNQIYETKNNFKKHEQVQDIHKLDKEMELKQFSERITRRLYKRILLEELRRVPKAEWIQFTKQIAEVDISESKYLNVLSKITNRISEIEVEQGERKVLAMSRRDIDFLKHLYDTNPQLILDIKRTVGIRDTYKTGERAGQFKDELKLIKDFTLEELNLFKNELKARIEFRQKNPVKILKNNTLETGDIPGYKNIKSIKFITKIILIIAFAISLFDMESSYYELLRFFGTIGFIYLSLDARKKNSNWWYVWGISALLLNPFFRINLDHSVWSIINIIWSLLLIASFKYKKK